MRHIEPPITPYKVLAAIEMQDGLWESNDEECAEVIIEKLREHGFEIVPINRPKSE